MNSPRDPATPCRPHRARGLSAHTRKCGMWVRMFGTLSIVAGLQISLFVVLTDVIASVWGRAALSVVVVVPLGMALMRLLGGPFVPILRAVADGLLSLVERDYALRLHVERADDLGVLVQRFNHLSAQLRAERNDLYQREMLLETVIEASPGAMVLCNEAHRVVLANGPARELFWSGDKAVGADFGAILRRLPPELRDIASGGIDVLFTTELRGEQEVFHVSRRFFQINTQQHVLYSVKPLSRELVRQEAEVWKRAIRIISHELNNSLAPILSLVHSGRVILRSPEHAPKLMAAFDVIEDRTDHLRKFLDGYARFAKLPRVVCEEVPWATFLHGVHSLYPFRLVGDIPAEQGWFDRAQMQQVLINLLKNAIESGSAPGEIGVAVQPVPGGVVLRVMDRGKGMTSDELEKALLPFYSTKKTGSGLGLALCREILEQHSGRLSIHPREGGGVEVECWLPSRPRLRPTAAPVASA